MSKKEFSIGKPGDSLLCCFNIHKYLPIYNEVMKTFQGQQYKDYEASDVYICKKCGDSFRLKSNNVSKDKIRFTPKETNIIRSKLWFNYDDNIIVGPKLTFPTESSLKSLIKHRHLSKQKYEKIIDDFNKEYYRINKKSDTDILKEKIEGLDILD